MLSKYEKFKVCLNDFFISRGINSTIEKTLHDVSFNDNGNNYLYKGSLNVEVISMDEIAQNSYRILRGVPSKEHRILNSVDAFLISADGIWYFIEFKDAKLKGQKDNIEKKGMANWLMLQDIFYEIGQEAAYGIIDLSNLSKFAREHIIYIVVFSAEKDPNSFNRVRDLDKLGEKYTPECLYKFKYYFFKDAYAYSEEYFEQRFVEKFVY